MALCAGGGGLELGVGLALGDDYRCVCYVEREAYAAATLAARMEEGRLAPAPVWDDLVTFDGKPWRGRVDILSGGFPCQPFSVAGQQRGVDDERNLWPAVARIIGEVQPDRVFLENVPGILRYYHERIGPDLRGMGYSTQTGLFTASETGAPHKRERLFILADAGLGGLCQSWDDGDERRTIRANITHVGNTMGSTAQWGGSELADAEGRKARESQAWDWGQGIGRRGNELAGLPLFPPGPSDHDGWACVLSVMPQAQPTFCRVDDGMAGRMVADRLAMLGNGVAPLAAAYAYRTLNTQMMEAA